MTVSLERGEGYSPIVLTDIQPNAMNRSLYLCRYDGSKTGEQRREVDSLAGYLYAAEIEGLGVKVGYSAKPHARLRSHAKASQTHGYCLGEIWISVPHREYVANEDALLALCVEHGELRTGREYFLGLTAFDVSVLSMTLPMTAVLYGSPAPTDGVQV